VGGLLPGLCCGRAAQRSSACRRYVQVPHCVPYAMAVEEGGVVPVRVLEAAYVLLPRKRGGTSPRLEERVAQVGGAIGESVGAVVIVV
jgi:hypothetical protein